MDHTALRERDVDVDLESGGTTSGEEDVSNSLSTKRQTQIFFDRVYRGFITGSAKGDNGVNLCGSISNSSGVLTENMKLLSVEHMEAKEVVKEKRKKTSKKSLKPPRPPRGPSLDAADHKLIKEISELVMLKRAKIERMKALKKMKAAKPSSSSSNSNLYAMVFTVVFCLVILLQGMSSRTSSPVTSQESPASAGVGNGDLISVHYYKNPIANDPIELASNSPNLVEEVAGSDPPEKLKRGTG